MVDYVVKLTRMRPRSRPWTTSGSAGRLRRPGDLQITLIASWFNYINRVADALGVGRD